MDPNVDTALVVGASGMLTDVVSWCAERYGQVVATCHTQRSAARLAKLGTNVVAVRADWTDPDEWWRRVGDRIDGRDVGLAVVWMHSNARDELWRRCQQAVPDGGLFIRVRGHAAARPGDGALAGWIDGDVPTALLDADERHLILGWRQDHGPSRWLEPIEIGRGVVDAIDAWQHAPSSSPVSWIGAVRPWDSRPRGWG